MTKTQIFKKILLELWYFILAYITEFIVPKIKEAFIQSKEHFISYLWNSIKEDVKNQLQNVLKDVEIYFSSADYEMKEKIAIDFLFNRIKLPITFKLFKPILKKLFRNKIHNLIKEGITSIHKQLNITA